MKRFISLCIVLCMIFVMFPTTAFAAESLGIYVGSTEVTTANYKNIKGPGISGKVYYDPEEHELVLDNATITSYSDSAPDDGVVEYVGLLSLWDTLNIRFVGKNTVQPDISGKTADNCIAIAGLGSLEIRGNGEDSLITKAIGSNNNMGILCAEKLSVHGVSIQSEAGPSSNGSSYGIYTKEFYAQYIPNFSVISGNCPNGESIAFYTSYRFNLPTYDCSFTVRSGDAQFSCGIYCEDMLSLNSLATVQSGSATEYDSIGIYAGGSVHLEHAAISITSGSSTKGSSIAIFSQSSIYSSNCKHITASSGYAPNGISAVLCSEGSVDLTSGGYQNVNLYAGNGLESYGIISVKGGVSLRGITIDCNAGTATQGDSIAVSAIGKVTFMDVFGEIHGGSAPNGYSYGVYSEAQIIFNTQFYNKTVITGQDAAVNCEVNLGRNDLYWSGNPDSTDPTRDMHIQGFEQLENAPQYKYLYIITDNYAKPTPFDDVPFGKFYVDPVLWAVENDITTGIDDLHFAPDQTCNRAQTVTFLWRACGSPEPETIENPFTDVIEGKYYYKAVLWAVENGITNGMTATTFEPETTVTRGQVATFLWRNAGKPEPETTENAFTDVNVTSFYATAVQWAVENGITTGMTSTTFEPDSGCTRGQIVTFLCRAKGEDEAADPLSKLIGEWFLYFDDTMSGDLSNIYEHSFRLYEDYSVVVDTRHPGGTYTSGYNGTWTVKSLGSGRYELVLTLRAEKDKFEWGNISDTERQCKLKVIVDGNRMLVHILEGHTGAPQNQKVYEKDLTFDVWLERQNFK